MCLINPKLPVMSSTVYFMFKLRFEDRKELYLHVAVIDDARCVAIYPYICENYDNKKNDFRQNVT